MTGTSHLLSSVLVPDLPPAPTSSGDAGPLAGVLAVITVGFAIAFTVVVVRAIYGRFPARPIRTLVALAAGLLVFCGGLAVSIQMHRDGEQRALDEQWDLEQVAEATVIAGLEETYGVTFTSSAPIIPLRASDAPWEEDVTLSDGTETTCWIDIEDDHYALLCGGDSLETSTRLDPVTS